MSATILGELKSAGVSVILIEHQPRFVFALCDEVTVLDAGEVVATGPAAEVRDERACARGLPRPMSAVPPAPSSSPRCTPGYGRYDVVRDLGLHVAEGEAVALLGPNGAGKTTVLRAIMGLVKHRRGSIRIGGQELVRMPTHRIARGHAALVPEGRRLFLNQSVEDNLLLGALHLRRDRRRVRGLLDSVYELFPLLRDVRGRVRPPLSAAASSRSSRSGGC